MVGAEIVLDFAAEVWEHTGEAAWFFLTVPVDESEDIRELAPPRRGFGSVRVGVTVGSTSWSTSVFPQSSSGCFILPVKKEVRRAEGIEAGDVVDVALRLVIE